jgi:hypothetical protein
MFQEMRKVFTAVMDTLSTSPALIGHVVVQLEKWDISDTAWTVISFRLRGKLLGYLRVFSSYAVARAKYPEGSKPYVLWRYCVEQVSEPLGTLAPSIGELEDDVLDELQAEAEAERQERENGLKQMVTKGRVRKATKADGK